MGFFNKLFGDNTDLICEQMKRNIENIDYAMFEAYTQDSRDAVVIELLTNMALEFNTKIKFAQAHKVFKKLLPQVVANKQLCIMFMDRLYGRAITHGLMSVQDAKNNYDDYVEDIFKQLVIENKD